MRRSVIYSILIIPVLIQACETYLWDVKGPDFEHKLVVTGFLTPGDSITYIHTGSNRPIYGTVNTDQPVGNLRGIITDGIAEVELDTFKSGFKLDHRRLEIQYGKEYRLRITSDAGLFAEASCKVPYKQLSVISVDTAWKKPEYRWIRDSKMLFLNISIPDDPAEKNYYSLKVLFRSAVTDASGLHLHTVDESGPRLVKSDKGFEGKEIMWQINTMLENEPDSMNVEVFLYHTEESYYLYHKSLNNYIDYDIPFTEPTPVYTNVTGGLGIFTSYTVDSVEINLK